MTKVIFLDIDGVLNNREAFKKQWRSNGVKVLCPAAVLRFRRLVAYTGAKVVLSSTWRRHADMVSYLRSHHVLDACHEDWHTKHNVSVPLMADSDGRAPFLVSVGRGGEIAEWLDRHPEVTEFVVLDDDPDALECGHPHRVVSTLYEIGLTEEDFDKALNMIGTSMPLPQDVAVTAQTG